MVPNPLPEEACQPSQASNDKVSFTCALECERPSFREDTFYMQFTFNEFKKGTVGKLQTLFLFGI
jgi:hypothetical protein